MEKWDGDKIGDLIDITIQLTADQCQDVACTYDNAEKISNTIAELYL